VILHVTPWLDIFALVQQANQKNFYSAELCVTPWLDVFALVRQANQNIFTP
jgi:hypothetical protein